MPDDFLNSVSVVIVNYDRVETTLKAVDCVNASTGGFVREVIVVDNGSAPQVVAALSASLEGKARLVVLGTNRYFGEGNNIGVEEATGELILLLNNDAYVEQSCIEELVGSLREAPGIAAAGPMFLYPSGAVQEVGGLAMASGDVVQVGKGAIWGADHYTEQCAVDYCSAACLLMRKRDFVDVGGFSLQWEPAYYEDVDLCLMLWQQVGPVVVNPRARVVHLESLTTGDAKMRLESQVEINRLSFVEKWGEWLRAKQAYRPPVTPLGFVTDTHTAAAPVEADEESGPRRAHIRKAVESAGLYTPYELIPGGGERVLFELGSVLVDAIGPAGVRVAAPHRYSDLRMRQLCEAFGLSGPTRTATEEDMRADPPDLGVVLGNEAVPPRPGPGRRFNIYLCQFPFDAPPEYIRRNADYLATFDEIWVYSDFVRRYLSGHVRLLGLRTPRIRVIYPPATVPAPDGLRPWHERCSVMTVGRFFKGGHNKRQDVVIDVVRQLSERFGRSVPLVVAGSLHASADSRDRFRELVAMADGIESRFYPNVSRERLAELYSEAAVLVHATGYGIDKLAFPERLEHFGITPLEAASLGCIPVVYGEGGPAEVMDILRSPTKFWTIPEAAEMINGLFADPEGADRLSRDLIRGSDAFSRRAFRSRVEEALSGVL